MTRLERRPRLRFDVWNRAERRAHAGVTVWRDRPGAAHPLRTQTNFMFDPSPEPPKEATDLAFALLQDSMGRGMDYEEFTFEIDGGEHDGEEYKVVVMKI